MLKNLQEKVNIMETRISGRKKKENSEEPSNNYGIEKYNICRKVIDELKNKLIEII